MLRYEDFASQLNGGLIGSGEDIEHSSPPATIDDCLRKRSNPHQ